MQKHCNPVQQTKLHFLTLTQTHTNTDLQSPLTKTYFHMLHTQPLPTQRDADGGALGEGLAYQVLSMRFVCLINDLQLCLDCSPDKVFG